MKERAAQWFGEHNALACAGLFAGVAAALIGIFAFVTFSGFGASVDFIYNQF